MSCLPWLSSLELRGAKIIVAGAPCSGKTTFAAAHALPGDEILDYDVVHAELTGLPLYVHDESQISRTVDEFGGRAIAMRQGWIIRTAPTAADRTRSREAHNARSIVLEVWPGECLARLERSDRPDAAKSRLRPVIEEWWNRYSRYGGRDYDARTWTWLGIPHESVLSHFELGEQPQTAIAAARRDRGRPNRSGRSHRAV
ncbi:MAG: hypothetical protein AABM40_05850 [Chloroflexota bacterium]